MNRYLRLLAAAAAAILGVPAAASTDSTDYTDLWYLPAESGWGVNVIQQYDVVFATFFLYGVDGTPRWYTAPETLSVAAPAGENRFTGNLYSTVGSWFGVPWSPAAYAPTYAGTVTFNFTSPTTGTVTYTINNVPVTKVIERQTWRGNPLTGSYVGGLSARGFNCSGVQDGPILVHGELTVNHVNILNPTFQVDYAAGGGQTARCTFSGGYAQEGRLGRVTDGTWACSIPGVSNPPFGVFSLTQIEGNTKGFNARFTGSDQNCSYEGYFGGILRMF